MLNKMTVVKISLTVSLLVAAICLISWVLVMGGFTALEQRLVKRNISMAQEVLDDVKNNLVVKLSDWALWDDTYNFVENKNEAYISSNLADSTVTNLGINMIGFFDTQGESIWFIDNTKEGEAKSFLPAGLRRYMAKGSILFDHVGPESFVAGIILVPEGPLLVAVKPIFKSDMTGPSRGIMLFAKYINADELKRLGDLIKVEMDLRKLEDPALPADLAVARSAFYEGKKFFIQPLDNAAIAGYAHLKDIFGAKEMVLKIVMPREITQFGFKTLLYFMFFLILVGLIFGLVVYVPLESELAGKAKAERNQEELLVQLQDERKNLEAIFDSTQVGLMLVDSTLKVKRLNQVVLNLGGKELLGVVDGQPGDALSCIHADEALGGCGSAPDCKACPVRAAAKMIIATGRSVRDAVFSRKIRLASGEEKLVWLEINATPMEIGGERHILFSLANITERKEIEQERQKSYSLLKTLIDAMPNLVYFKDPDGIYKGCNSAFAAALGKEPQDVIGKTVFDLFPQDVAQQHHDNDILLIRHRSSKTYEVKFKFVDGIDRDVLVTKSSFADPEGRIAGIIGVMVDITERKKKEEEDARRAYEYEIFYKASVGREERIIELKAQVDRLKHELEGRKQA